MLPPSAGPLTASLVQPVVSGAVSLIDNAVRESGNAEAVETYEMIKAAMMMWNPEASRWASNASALYR